MNENYPNTTNLSNSPNLGHEVPHESAAKKGPKFPRFNPSLTAILSFCLIIAVALAGLFYYQNTRLKSMLADQTPPTPTPAESPVPDGTGDPAADWTTFTSQLTSLSFKYPPSYNSPEEHDATPDQPGGEYISLISPLNIDRLEKETVLQDGELKIEIFTELATGKDSPQDCWNDHDSLGQGKITGRSKLEIFGINYESLLWEGLGTGEFTCFVQDSNRYLINKYPATTSRQQEFSQILSTFRFIE